MAAVWFRFRSEIGARWRAGVAVALLIGVAAGVALAAAAVGRFVWERIAAGTGFAFTDAIPAVVLRSE